MMRVRRKIQIIGIISGKTFAMYLNALANKLGVCGWVKSSSNSIEIDAEADIDSINEFISDLHDIGKQLTLNLEIDFYDINILNSKNFCNLDEESDNIKENESEQDVVTI